MTGVIATIPRLRFGDGSGAPLAGGTLTIYAAGTTTLENSWQDRALTILNTNPVTLDAFGSCVVWLDSAKTYKLVVASAAGATLWTQDNIVGGGVDDSFEIDAAALQAAVDQAEAAALAAAGYLAAAQALVAGGGTMKRATHLFASGLVATIADLNAPLMVFYGSLIADTASYSSAPGSVTFSSIPPGVTKAYIFYA